MSQYSRKAFEHLEEQFVRNNELHSVWIEINKLPSPTIRYLKKLLLIAQDVGVGVTDLFPNSMSELEDELLSQKESAYDEAAAADAEYNQLRERALAGLENIKAIDANNNTAAVLEKALEGAKAIIEFERFRGKMKTS